MKGLTVVALEQAVAAPICTSHLADVGARVLKIERPDGDFARGYDDVVTRQSSYRFAGWPHVPATQFDRCGRIKQFNRRDHWKAVRLGGHHVSPEAVDLAAQHPRREKLEPKLISIGDHNRNTGLAQKTHVFRLIAPQVKSALADYNARIAIMQPDRPLCRGIGSPVGFNAISNAFGQLFE